MKTVVKGDMFILDNQQRKFGGDPQYILLWATLPGQQEPSPLLLTDEQVADAINRATQNQEDIAELGTELPVNEFD